MSSPLLLSFAVVLLIGVLISERASRTIISTAVLFLLAGFVLGEGVLGVLDIRSGHPLVETLAELALFSVLFTDGMRVGLPQLRSAWQLPGRALLLGLPLTLAQPPGDLLAPDNGRGEHRVGRGEHGSEQEGLQPRQPDDVVGKHRGGRQGQRQPQQQRPPG